MTFPAATPKPFQVTTREEHLLPQSRGTGLVVPEGQGPDATTVTREGPKAKPWAHFVAGG